MAENSDHPGDEVEPESNAFWNAVGDGRHDLVPVGQDRAAEARPEAARAEEAEEADIEAAPRRREEERSRKPLLLLALLPVLAVLVLYFQGGEKESMPAGRPDYFDPVTGPAGTTGSQAPSALAVQALKDDPRRFLMRAAKRVEAHYAGKALTEEDLVAYLEETLQVPAQPGIRRAEGVINVQVWADYQATISTLDKDGATVNQDIYLG